MENLDAPLLRKILSFVGSAQDFRSCEKTNKAWNAVLKDDKVWSLCKECKPKNYPQHPYLNRELALLPIALQSIKKWQDKEKKSSSVILDVLSVSGWNNLVDHLLNRAFFPTEDDPAHRFEVRGDTSAVLLWIVEENILQQLRRSNTISLHRRHAAESDKETKTCSQTKFPTVTLEDFQVQRAMDPLTGDSSGKTPTWHGRWTSWRGIFLIDLSARIRLVTCMAWRAGIAKMDYPMYRKVWGVLISTIMDVLMPACYLLAEEVDPRELRRSFISSAQPFPVLPKRVVCGTRSSADKIIRKIPPLPRLLPETSAKSHGIIPNKVLGNEWLVEGVGGEGGEGGGEKPTTAKRKEQAILEAMSHYTFVDEDDEDQEDDDEFQEGKVVEPKLPVHPDALMAGLAGVVQANVEVVEFDDSDTDEESYDPEEDDDEEEEDIPDDFLVEEDVNEVFVADADDPSYDSSSCTHPNGFVSISTLPNIIL